MPPRPTKFNRKIWFYIANTTTGEIFARSKRKRTVKQHLQYLRDRARLKGVKILDYSRGEFLKVQGATGPIVYQVRP